MSEATWVVVGQIFDGSDIDTCSSTYIADNKTMAEQAWMVEFCEDDDDIPIDVTVYGPFKRI